jgi:hypothetical protein
VRRLAALGPHVRLPGVRGRAALGPLPVSRPYPRGAYASLLCWAYFDVRRPAWLEGLFSPSQRGWAARQLGPVLCSLLALRTNARPRAALTAPPGCPSQECGDLWSRNLADRTRSVPFAICPPSPVRAALSHVLECVFWLCICPSVRCRCSGTSPAVSAASRCSWCRVLREVCESPACLRRHFTSLSFGCFKVNVSEFNAGRCLACFRVCGAQQFAPLVERANIENCLRRWYRFEEEYFGWLNSAMLPTCQVPLSPLAGSIDGLSSDGFSADGSSEQESEPDSDSPDAAVGLVMLARRSASIAVACLRNRCLTVPTGPLPYGCAAAGMLARLPSRRHLPAGPPAGPTLTRCSVSSPMRLHAMRAYPVCCSALPCVPLRGCRRNADGYRGAGHVPPCRPVCVVHALLPVHVE